MHEYIPRLAEIALHSALEQFPAVVLLGPRQCGKSTLAGRLLRSLPGAVYLDLERPADRRVLTDPDLFFAGIRPQQLICLDEVQVLPELFPVLRGILDRRARPGQVLLLGSASRDLINHSAESLAGRIHYLELTPFRINEVAKRSGGLRMRRRWLRGGYPASLLAANARRSLLWRESFIQTYVERDLPQLGFAWPAPTLLRFWRMCAHMHGQTLNASKLGESMGVSHPTIRRYLEGLTATFVVRLLPPLFTNAKKRLVKSPKLYIRDSGLCHALLEITTFEQLLAHPSFGASWEGMVLEEVISALPFGWQASFYRDSNGNELDLVVEGNGRRFAIGCKASSAPTLTKGFYAALQAASIEHAWVVAPVERSYSIAKHVTVSCVTQVVHRLLRRAGGRL